ncbi:hypothetical protein GMO_18440 [Gluconobacter morbifer G707]|uniref:Uncharacterized protein n=1 Tax=Gluconobacter morbifer G707 TaxID=1088869 RepID=G6XJH2_9PROT|nr:hypothetical protein GMO_18440 [Gluconobacter morbifer G707]
MQATIFMKTASFGIRQEKMGPSNSVILRCHLLEVILLAV